MKISKILTLFLFCICSCATYNNRNPYPNMRVLHFNNYSAYEFNDSYSEKLIIVFDGSGYYSSLGRYDRGIWRPVSMASQLVPLLREEYTILVPDKFDRSIGNDYFEDMDDRANYTAENLLNCYITIINSYLDENIFNSVILVANSESAKLLPIMFENIIKNELITGMVSIAGGGLSMYEEMIILSTSNVTPKRWKNGYLELINIFEENNFEFPDSIILGFNGMSLRWYNSMINIRPYDYYENINIPILFLHGNKDYLVPVESTIYIQNNLVKKTFEYVYYENMGHAPRNSSQTIRLRNDITNWINNINK